MTAGTITVNRGTTTGHVGQGFAGLSFEKTHVANGSLTAQNTALINLFRLLGPSVVRLGADDVDHETWAPGAMPGGGAAPFPPTVGTADVDQLADFLNATGWKTIYGVNFKSGTPANSAEEAKYATTKLGASLFGIEIGNEINLGAAGNNWASIKTRWESFLTAVLAAAPGVPIIGPDSAGSGVPGFLAPFVQDEGSKLSVVTAHYYRAQAGTTGATIASLLGQDAALVTRLHDVQTATTASHVPGGYRFDESNTFSHHGQDGVSNALVAALWSLDFMFTNAMNGATGVNFHGGQLGSDASLPTLPFFYAPIQEANGAVTAAAPLFYGMLFFTLAGNGNVLGTTVSGGANLTAYAIAQADGSTNVILDNKDAASAVTATVDVGGAVAAAGAVYLQGPTPVSLAATGGVTVAGSGISATGIWTPKPPYALTVSGNTVKVVVPPASAALVHAR